MAKIRLFISFLIVIFFNISINSFSQINIVSGLKGEVYNQFARDIANNTSVKSNVYTSKGSVDNLKYILSDSIQIAFLQYDQP